jgi:hypothetical protein
MFGAFWKRRIQMKILFALLGLVLVSQTAAADTYVRGYMRNNGTYVEPHHRTNPNNNVFDNYSTQGNTNPYTGQQGTVDPYKPSNPGFGSSPYGGHRRGW